ncbi:MAG: hypothetical protein Q9209_003554 [Squamulea sp. 1 TL-2023]
MKVLSIYRNVKSMLRKRKNAEAKSHRICHSNPCSLQDFIDYLAYVTNDAENLQFYLWLVDYHQRFHNAPPEETALSPKWNFDDAPSSPRHSGNSNYSAVGGSDKTLSLLGVKDFDAIEEEDISNASLIEDRFRGDPPSPYTATLGTLKFSEVPLADSKPSENNNRSSNNAQPFRLEINRLISHYIAPGGPRELNLSHKDRAAVLYALRRTTHPSAFHPIKKVLDMTLRNQSHPNFVRWSICNGNKPWTIFLRTFAVCNIVIGFAIAILLTLSHASRWYRILAALEWWFGITNLIAAYQGLCVLLLRRHTREVRPWEMDKQGRRYGASDEEAALRHSKVLYEETKSRWPVKMELFGPPNTWDNQTWMDRYGMKSIFKKTLEKEVPTQEHGLHFMQNRIVRQAEAWALIITIPLTIFFTALPNAEPIGAWSTLTLVTNLATGPMPFLSDSKLPIITADSSKRSCAMSSNKPPAPGQPPERLRPTPDQLQTDNTTHRSQRFSWQQTPLEVQQPTFQQFSSPANSIIDESPISSPDGYQAYPSFPQPQDVAQYPIDKPSVQRIDSPYNLPGPHGTHPAYFAPVVDESVQRQPVQQQPGPDQPEITSEKTGPEKAREPVQTSPPASFPDAYTQERKDSAQVVKPDIDKSALVYSPNSLAGPNATLENHRPGQVAHPNATVEPEWKHGLCEVDTLCCVGLCCPCIVYGKTQYRVSRKAQKEDATNMLGYKTCNGSCGLMSLACGFQCE